MSETTTTAPSTSAATAPKAPEIPLRPLTRNEVSLTPVWEPVQRGVSKNVFYPVVLPTVENFDQWLAYKGKKAVVEALAAQERQNAQATMDYIANKHGLWIEEPKLDANNKVITESVQEEYEEQTTDGKTVMRKRYVDRPKVGRRYYSYSAIPIDDLLSLLEKDSVRSGDTIAGLNEENEELNTKLREMVVLAAKDPSVLVQALEITSKIQENTEKIERIREQRAKSKTAEAVVPE